MQPAYDATHDLELHFRSDLTQDGDEFLALLLMKKAPFVLQIAVFKCSSSERITER